MTLLAIALDTDDAALAVAMARSLGPHVDVLKVGLQLFVSAGPAVVHEVRETSGRPVFLDLKLDDIPNTVRGAARAAAGLGIGWLTVHTGAGEAACAAAAEGARSVSDPPRLLGVTVLTSLDARALKATGVAGDIDAVVDKRTRVAAAAGLDGVVCAGGDPGLVAHTTAGAAAAGGADMVVVGRPITAAVDPVAVALAVRAELDALAPST
jgi:orotidine-5'-phosphate decarboxylase